MKIISEGLSTYFKYHIIKSNCMLLASKKTTKFIRYIDVLRYRVLERHN